MKPRECSSLEAGASGLHSEGGPLERGESVCDGGAIGTHCSLLLQVSTWSNKKAQADARASW